MSNFHRLPFQFSVNRAQIDIWKKGFRGGSHFMLAILETFFLKPVMLCIRPIRLFLTMFPILSGMKFRIEMRD